MTGHLRFRLRTLFVLTTIVLLPLAFFANRHLRLDRLDWIGFDMDYTLVRYHTLPMETLDYVSDLVARFRAECEAAGTTPRLCLMREGWVGQTDAEVEAEWYQRALSFHRYYWDAGTKGDDHDPVLQRVAAGEDPPYQEFVRDRAFAGTPDLVIDEIRRWHDAIGFDEVCLIFATGREATTPEALGRAVTLFADEVMPAFA